MARLSVRGKRSSSAAHAGGAVGSGGLPWVAGCTIAYARGDIGAGRIVARTPPVVLEGPSRGGDRHNIVAAAAPALAVQRVGQAALRHRDRARTAGRVRGRPEAADREGWAILHVEVVDGLAIGIRRDAWARALTSF